MPGGGGCGLCWDRPLSDSSLWVRALLVGHPDKPGQIDVCALLPLQSHTTARHKEISFSYLETVISDGKMGQVLFI